MRLLVVSQYFWPESFRINDLVAELAARGHEVTVLTGKPNYPGGTIFADFASNPEHFARFGSTDVIRLPMLPRGKGSVRLALNYLTFAISGVCLAPFLLRRRKFDAIFVCQLSPVTSALPAVTMRWLRGIPSVLWVLDLWPQSLEAVGAVRSKLVLAAVGKLVGFIYRRSDLLLGQSRSFVADISSYLPDPSRVGYLPSWSESDEDSAAAEPAPEVPLRTDLFNIVFTGNIGEAQDFPAVLAAAERLRASPVRWIVVGDGRKAEWLRSEIVRRGLESSILMPGRFPLERMPSFYRHADALLVSLRPEPIFAMTIPAKVQAYLNAGKPILAMLDGEGSNVVREAGAGHAVAAGDAEGLAEAIRRLMAASSSERAGMARNARDYAAREFHRSTLITRLEAELAALVQKRRSTPPGRRGP